MSEVKALEHEIARLTARVRELEAGLGIDPAVVSVISTNVIEQRRLAEEQERFFNLSVDMLCVANTQGYFTRVNPAFEATLGFGEELVQRPFLEFVHPDDRPGTSAAMQRLVRGEVLTDFENRYRCKSGGYRTLSWRATRDPVTQLLYAVARDVTYRRNLEEQLRQSQKMEAVGKLAGGVAHDFNNLLLAIQGNLEFATKGVGMESNQHLNEAMLATQRAAALVRQLLALSRQQPINTVRLKLDVLLRSLMNLLRRLIPENIEIVLEARNGKRAIVADRSQLEQVIINLCVNARDSMPDGGRVTLRVQDVSVDEQLAGGHPWARPGDFVSFSVTDTGTGMSREVQDRVFEPFYTTKPPGRGTGLGLSTVYGIVQSHGGFVTVESQLGRGSTFRIYLPAAERADAERVPEERAVLGGSETILVAEDEEMVRSVVVRILASAGYRVITAADGVEAVNLFAEHPDIALVLLDVVMPKLGGPDAAARMRRIRADVRVLFTSGYVHASLDDGKLESAVVLAKPYRPEALLQQVRQLLDAD